MQWLLPLAVLQVISITVYAGLTSTPGERRDLALFEISSKRRRGQVFTFRGAAMSLGAGQEDLSPVLGEMANNPQPPAIAAAVYEAIGVWVTELPITPERVLRAGSIEYGAP